MTATDQLTGKLLEIINQIQSGVVAHASDALNLILASTQISCLQQLILGVLSLIGILIIGLIIWIIKIKIDKDKKNDIPHYEKINWNSDGIALILMILVVLGALLLFVSVCTILNIWEWVGLFNPKVYLAHEIIQKVVS